MDLGDERVVGVLEDVPFPHNNVFLPVLDDKVLLNHLQSHQLPFGTPAQKDLGKPSDPQHVQDLVLMVRLVGFGLKVDVRLQTADLVGRVREDRVNDERMV